jgi:hypothetical protein
MIAEYSHAAEEEQERWYEESNGVGEKLSIRGRLVAHSDRLKKLNRDYKDSVEYSTIDRVLWRLI